MSIVGGHFVVEPEIDAPSWFIKAYFNGLYDAVPVKSNSRKSIIFVSPSPKYIGGVPPVVNFEDLIEYIKNYSADYQFIETFSLLDELYPYPLPEESENVIQNYFPGVSPSKISMTIDGYIEDIKSVYDFLGIKITFTREYVSVDEYTISVDLPPFGRTYKAILGLMIKELDLKDDEKELLKKFSEGETAKWLYLNSSTKEWKNKRVLFTKYRGVVVDVISYPVLVIEL